MDMRLDGAADSALSRLQDTSLSPMEEVLFKSWAKANQIKEPDAPGDIVDYRGIYKHSNGEVLPHGQLKLQAEQQNNEHKLQQILQQKMMDRIQEAVGKQEDMGNQLHKEERQDITHKQKMEQEGMKLKRAPHELQMKKHDLEAKGIGVQVKKMDLEKQRIGLDAARLGNEGKQLDLKGQEFGLINSMMNPMGAGNGAATKTGTTSSSPNSKRS